MVKTETTSGSLFTGRRDGNLKQNLTDQNWHNYALNWRSNLLEFYIDDVLVYFYSNDGSIEGWPFNRSMNIILNLKLGLPGDKWYSFIFDHFF